MVNMHSSFVSQNSCGASSFREQSDYGKWFESHPQDRGCRLSLSLTEAVERGLSWVTNPAHALVSEQDTSRTELPCVHGVFGAVAPCPALGRGTWCPRALLCLGDAGRGSQLWGDETEQRF